MINVKYTSICHVGGEFVEAGTTLQQQGQAMCQNLWETNGAQYIKIPQKNLYLSWGGKKMY